MKEKIKKFWGKNWFKLGLGKSVTEKERSYENCLREHGLAK